jgi:hypothetical protein
MAVVRVIVGFCACRGMNEPTRSCCPRTSARLVRTRRHVQTADPAEYAETPATHVACERCIATPRPTDMACDACDVATRCTATWRATGMAGRAMHGDAATEERDMPTTRVMSRAMQQRLKALRHRRCSVDAQHSTAGRCGAETGRAQGRERRVRERRTMSRRTHADATRGQEHDPPGWSVVDERLDEVSATRERGRVRVSRAEIFLAARATAHTGQSSENRYYKRVSAAFTTAKRGRASALLKPACTTMSVAT